MSSLARRTKKACQVCGKPFSGGTDCHYCPECARARKSDTVVKIRTCQDCGVDFFGGPRARRCPDCAYTAKLENGRCHRKNGTMRPIGSIDRCEVCGKEYSVVAGRQKYCSIVCQRKSVLEWQREHKKGYAKSSGQDVKKQERRKQTQKICVYCLRTFSSRSSTNFCSEYCRTEHKKLLQCLADINRGYNRNLKLYEEKRENYRRECKNVR